MIYKDRASAPEEAKTRSTESAEATPGASAPTEAAALEGDDDFVPPDIFGRRSAADRESAAAASPVPATDADFIPPDIFQPVVAPDEAKQSPHVSATDAPEKLVESSTESRPAPFVSPDANHTDDSVADLHDRRTSNHRGNPGSAESTASTAASDRPSPSSEEAPLRKPLKTADWFKPFPVAPPLPSLLLPSTPLPSVKELPDPEPAVVAVPRPAAEHGDAPVKSTTTRDEPPRAKTSRIPSSVDDLLRLAASLRASTLYLSSNTPPSVRIDGVVQGLEGTPVLGPNEIETLLVSLLLSHHSGTRGALAINRWTFDLPDVGRVRCITFTDTRGPGAVFRIVPIDKAAEEPVDLSLDIQALALEREGLVIVAGPRGSGKQAVIGALVDLVKNARHGYVITVQRELNAPKHGEGSFISQREALGGLDDMLTVARAALQEDPDVLVLEEVRSAPLMSLAFEAAASGQLIIAGFTAPTASGAVERIIDLFPPEKAREVQISLAHHLRGVVGQMLLPKIGGGRVAARELLLNTRAVSNVLAAGKAAQLGAAIAAGRNQGMVAFGDVLAELVQSGGVAVADAYRQAPDPVGLIDELKRRGIDTSFVHRVD